MAVVGRLVLIVTLAVLAATVVGQDHCNKYHSCAACVKDLLCGWCSNKVQYEAGRPGHHCAGFNQNGSNPFICDGVYSTVTCKQGWLCNETEQQCYLGPPGQGEPQAKCENNCSSTGKTYLCDNSTFQCKEAPPGQGTSLQVCEQQCQNSTSSPSSSSPASPSPASPSPASPSPGSPSPSPHSNLYSCNTTTL